MSSFFNCPHCQQLFEAEPEMFGMTCACSHCAGLFSIPVPEGAPEAPFSAGQPGAEGGAADDAEALFPAQARARLEEWEEWERESQERIRILEQALEESRRKVEELVGEAGERTKEVARGEGWRQRAEEGEAEGKRLSARVEQLEAEVLEAKRRVEDRQELEKEKEALVEKVEGMIRELQREQGQVRAAEESARRAGEEMHALRLDWEKVAQQRDQAVVQAGDAGRELADLKTRLAIAETSIQEAAGREVEARQKAVHEAERRLREELERETRDLRTRSVDLETRARELETALDGERQRVEQLQARADSTEALLQAAQQEVAVQAERLRQAGEFRTRHEQRLAEARESEARLRQDLRKAGEALDAEQAARERDLERIEEAIEKEREALERSEELANRLEQEREAAASWPGSAVEPEPAPGWQKTEVARLEAEIERSQRLLDDAERRASLAEEQFAELLVEWESRKRLVEAYPELNDRVEEQKSALEGWEKRGEEWRDREADLRDTIEARQTEIEEMRAAIRLLQQSEWAPPAPVSPPKNGWIQAVRSPWALPLGLGFGLALGLGIGFWGGTRSEEAQLAEAYGPKVPKGATRKPLENGGGPTAPQPVAVPGEREAGTASAEAAKVAAASLQPEGSPGVPGIRESREPDSAKMAGGVNPGAVVEKDENAAAPAAGVTKAPAMESAAGNVNGEGVLPTQFLGVKFGSLVSENPGLAQWLLEKGIYHRKARLVGVEVEAAITADPENRVVKGSYVRVCPRSTEELSPFLEWAVSVQDAISAQYGDPTEVQEIQEAADAAAIVDRIASGKARYIAAWRRDTEDGSILLSIGAMNERSVVFRLDYFSAALIKAFNERQENERLNPVEATEAKPGPSQAKPDPSQAKPDPSQAKPDPSQAKPDPSQAKPDPSGPKSADPAPQ
jgi:hypothetical protein